MYKNPATLDHEARAIVDAYAGKSLSPKDKATIPVQDMPLVTLLTATPAGTAVPVVDPELAHDTLHNFVLQSLLVFGRGIILNERISDIVLPFGLMPAYTAPQAFPACAGARVVFTASRACTRLSGREYAVGNRVFLLNNHVAMPDSPTHFTGTAFEAVVNVALLPATETGTSVPVMDSE